MDLHISKFTDVGGTDEHVTPIATCNSEPHYYTQKKKNTEIAKNLQNLFTDIL